MKATKSISEELLTYLKANFDGIFNNAVESLKYRSAVTTECGSEKRNYAFVGVGCGITYLVYRKNNKKCIEIEDAARKYRHNEILKMFLLKFTKEEIEYYSKIGCPLEAIWSQDQGMQISYYDAIVDFCETKGLKVTYRSFLD